jgi:hypothetical protein
VITVVTAVFFALVLFIFWLGSLGEKAEAHGPGYPSEMGRAPAIAGGSDH